jgi:hypothetical protein
MAEDVDAVYRGDGRPGRRVEELDENNKIEDMKNQAVLLYVAKIGSGVGTA